MSRIAAILTLAILALAASIGGTTPAAAADVITDKLICAITFWPPQSINRLADELGYFEQEGVEVEYIFDDDLTVQFAAMDTGQINCNSRTVGEYQSRPRDDDTMGVIIGVEDISMGGDAIIASAEIQSVCDLRGKLFAYEPTVPAPLLLQKALKEECGMTFDDLETTNISTADALGVFADPKVDAVAVYEPVATQILNAGIREGAHRLLDSADYPGLIVDVWFVDQRVIEANPEMVRGYLRAVYRAIDYFMANPEKAAEFMAPFFNLTPEEILETLEGGPFVSYDEAVVFMGTHGERGTLHDNFDTVMQLNVESGVADALLSSDTKIDNSIITDLFVGHER
ncbi:MAG: ABC transporter substrate-binding protein [Proteobacteria bacterium]|nr:ABC transporter substrate-binding protein [Pseudomonadota bacterium]